MRNLAKIGLFLLVTLVVLGGLAIANGKARISTPTGTVIANAEQVKVFSHSFNNEGDRQDLENSLNTWLKENDGKVEIMRVLQSTSGTQFNQVCVITIWYRNK